MEQKLIKYVRDDKGLPRGVVIAMKISGDKWNIGWAICHKNDEYNPNIAHKIAESRAKCVKKHNGKIVRPNELKQKPPTKVYEDIHNMYMRGKKYFKDASPCFTVEDFKVEK